MRLYASDETGKRPGSSVWFWTASIEAREDHTEEEKGVFSSLCQGSQPQPGQRVVYVDGGFDLFSSGHIEFLRQVINDTVIDIALEMIDRYALRAYDAVQLAGCLVLSGLVREALTFVCADHRLLDAARSEQLRVLDPTG